MTVPTARSWATAAVRYIADAYRLEVPESLALVDELVSLVDRIGPLWQPGELRVPVAVVDESAGRVNLTEDQAAVRPIAPIQVPAAAWADFVSQFFAASGHVDPSAVAGFWAELCDLFEAHELPDRDVVFVSPALQDALALDPNASP